MGPMPGRQPRRTTDGARAHGPVWKGSPRAEADGPDRRPDRGRGRRRHAGRAAPGDRPRHADRGEHHRRAADPDDGDVRQQAARLRGVPGGDPGRDAVPARAERQRHPVGAARRLRRQGDRHLRPLRHRRLAGRGHHRVLDPRGHPVRGHHQRRRPRRRGRGPLHPRRDARQADGDRRRPQRRPDRRRRGAATPCGGGRRGRLLRRDGRRLEVRQGRRDRGDRDHPGQPARRVHRRRASRRA